MGGVGPGVLQIWGEGRRDWVIVKVQLSPRCRFGGGFLPFFYTSRDGVYDRLSVCCVAWLEIQLMGFGN